MSKNYFAKVIKLDTIVEEEVEVIINDIKLVCFAVICPYKIEIGKSYPVELSFEVFDELRIQKSDVPLKTIERLNQTDYQYKLTGLLKGNVLDAGLSFDDDFFYEYSYLDGEYVELHVDRLNIEFLENGTKKGTGEAPG